MKVRFEKGEDVLEDGADMKTFAIDAFGVDRHEGELMAAKNVFDDIYEANPQEFMLMLHAFLERTDLTLFGVGLAPKKIIKLRREIMRRGMTVEELQK